MVKKGLKQERHSLVGLGGWLILIQILIYFELYAYLKRFLVVVFYKSLEKFVPQNLSQIASNISSSTLILSGIFYFILVCFNIYLLVLLYTKKKSFRNYAIAYTWIGGVLVDLVGLISILVNPSKLNILQTITPNVSAGVYIIISVLGVLFGIAISIV